MLPDGSAVVTMDMMVMVKLELPTAGTPGDVSLSITCTVKVAGVPSVMGVPEITPVDGSRDNPGGRVDWVGSHAAGEPESTHHVYGAKPPEAVS